MHRVLTLAASPESASVRGSCVGWPESINATPFVSVTLEGAPSVTLSGCTLFVPWEFRVRYYFSVQTASAAEDTLARNLPYFLNALESDPQLSGSAMHCHIVRIESDPPLTRVGNIEFRRCDIIMSAKERIDLSIAAP